MAFSKQHDLSLYGAFYLPLAVLTGLSLSVILPPALNFLIPAMDSVLFISMPHLWNAFLSWVTPPCLFVLLNGIIVVLTASSGALSSSESDSGSDFYAHLLVKKNNAQNSSSGGLIGDPPASDSSTDTLLKAMDVRAQSSAAEMVSSYSPASSEAVVEARSASKMAATHNAVPSARALYGWHGVLETGIQSNLVEEEEDDDDDGGEKPSNSSTQLLAMESRSLSQTSSIREADEEEGEEEESDERISVLPKLDVERKSFSYGYRSEPSSPICAMPSKGNPIKRSLSVDLASFDHNNQTSTISSSEELSDEAFRKRVEAFISKMNAQLRSEAK